MEHWSILRPTSDTTLKVTASDGAIRGIQFTADAEANTNAEDVKHPLILEAARQLELYFARKLEVFDLPLEMHGTRFQMQVWETLLKIPYGTTISYAELADRVGSPKGFRAVGAANGKNPIPIVVPCHRVIESNGGLGGFSCGIAYKRRLLDLESGLGIWQTGNLG